MSKISIIVPIYNTQEYLSKCLDSLLNQTIDDIEIIAVDDGSTDSSPAILDRYASKSTKIKAIHTENKGVSSARNLALSVAVGDYIGFVDSDDWVESDMFSFLYENALKNDSDVVICGCYPLNHGKKKKKFSGRGALLEMFDANGLMQGFSSTRLIKRTALGELRYDETLRCFEDLVFFYYLFKQCSNVYWHDVPLYHYEVNPNSATYSYRMNPNKRKGYKNLKEIALLEKDLMVKTAIERFLYLSCVNMAIDYVSHGNVGCVDFLELKTIVRKKHFVSSCNLRQFLWRFIILNDGLKKLYWKIKGIAKEDA